jgi:phospholipase C
VRRSLLALTLLGACLVAGAASAGLANAASVPAVTVPSACGRTPHQRPVIRHVVVVVMENHGLTDVIGHAPFITALAHKCGLANNYWSVGSPSLPNYLAMTSGSTHGLSRDCDPRQCPQGGPSIFSQVAARGLGWRAYDESMPSTCGIGATRLYAPRHNPAVYYTGLRSSCRRHVLPLGSLSTGLGLHRALGSTQPPGYTFVTPNLCSDMHDCSVSTGDTWLSRWIPMMTKSRAYRAGHTVILLTWDEGGGDNQVPLIVVSPYTRAGTVSSRALNHYSLLRASEHLLGFHRYLGAAKTSSGLGKAFHL